jgi:hypothetical protein
LHPQGLNRLSKQFKGKGGIMRKFFVLLMFLVFFVVSPSMAADITGNWQLDMKGPAGPETVKFAVKVTGENLAITGEHSSFGKFEGAGTLKGDVIQMTFPYNVNGTMVNFVFDGTVKGDKMEGIKSYYPQSGENANKGPVKMEGVSDAWTAVRK